jgi:hypothetical protein
MDSFFTEFGLADTTARPPRTDLRARLAKMACNFCTHYNKTADNHSEKSCVRLMMGWLKELKACTRENCTRYDCSYGHYHDEKLVWTKWQKKWQRMARHYIRTGEFLPEETEERRSGALGGGDVSAPTPAATAEANTEKQRKESLGELLYPLIAAHLMEAAEVPAVAEMYAKYTAIGAGKITGMLLEGYGISDLEAFVSDKDELASAMRDAIDVIMAHEDKKNNKTSTPAPAPEPKPDAKPEDLWAEIARLNALLDTSNYKIGFLEYQRMTEMRGRIAAERCAAAERAGRIAAEQCAATAERQTQDALSVVRLMASSKPAQG